MDGVVTTDNNNKKQKQLWENITNKYIQKHEHSVINRFLEKYFLPKPKQKEVKHLNTEITASDIEAPKEKFPTT